MVDSLEKEEIKRGKNEVIPCIYERCFAYVYDQNKNNLAHLLASILNVDVLKIKNNITKIADTNDLKNKNDKQRRMDFVYRIDNLSLDIELNLKPRPIKERNINYLMSLHLRKFKKGNRYEDNYRTIQININNEMIDESDEVIEEYYFRKEDGKEYSIDRVCSRQRAAATKVGGTGIRYTIMIGGRQTYLFEDEDQWFVEAKNLHI